MTLGRHRTPQRDALVSIVTPVLNRADTIESVLASVAAQTYGSIEHIVVDGDSTDGTVDVVEAFSRSSRFPIRLISESDAGMYDAINKGLDMAKGEVLAYLNSDDLYFPWSVETAVDALHGGCDFVFGDVAIINTTEERTSFRLQFYRSFDPRYYLHAHLAQATVFWRRAGMERVGPFNRSLRYLGDVEYWVRVGLAGLKFCHLDEVLVLVTEHPGTLSIQQRDGVREERASIQESFTDRLGAPKYVKVGKRVEALRHRWRQLALRTQARREDPARWPKFIGMLRELDVEVGGNGMLVFLLPAAVLRKRPEWRRWFHSADDFEQRFLAMIRARASVVGPDAAAE